jgi:signal transduction histidine kinase
MKDVDVTKLFQPFSRLGSALEFHQSGAGMSLYVTKIIMQRLGGKISLKLLGKGMMCCEIEIPLRYADNARRLR